MLRTACYKWSSFISCFQSSCYDLRKMYRVFQMGRAEVFFFFEDVEGEILNKEFVSLSIYALLLTEHLLP